ncbi:MAG: 2-C-methyl-D-erythritol 4-phosphate cytidylyltransferase [Ruminococcus sp.]|jgi:2-C-methyl-D-erythritol 4-phosphate cytidylyltransferase
MREKCTAIVLAAGKGKRMGTRVQKQYLEVCGKPVLYYTLKCFQESPVIDEVILVTGKEEIEYCREKIVKNYHFTKVSGIVAGGDQRYDSVYEGLKICQNCNYVFIHDGARPFVDEEILEEALAAVREYGACVAAVPSKDTVKIVNDDGIISDTPDRNKVWIVQTPQVFSYELIRGAYDKMMKLPHSHVTDDAMVVEWMEKRPVKVTKGSYYNIKITTPEDMQLAEIFVRQKAGKAK